MARLIIIIGALWSIVAFAVEKIPIELKEVGIFEHLGERISLQLPFEDEEGNVRPLKHYFDDKHPVILNLVYHNCPNLCHYLLDGFTRDIKQLAWDIGKEFKVLTISIDPTETRELSKKKKDHYVKKYGRENAREGWYFLIGDQKNIKQLAQEIGFKYKYDPDQKEYAHSAGIFILTPAGKISRYLYGIQFKPIDLRLSLLEAAEGKIGNVVDKLLLFCYHYDPKSRKYAIFAINLMKIAGLITILCLVLLIVISIRRKRIFE